MRIGLVKVKPDTAVAVAPSEIVVEPTVTCGLAMYVLEIVVAFHVPAVTVPTVLIEDEPADGDAPSAVSAPDALVALVPPAAMGKVPAVKADDEVE